MTAVLQPRGPVSAAFASRCTPRPRLTVSEWADKYRVVPAGTSPEPGAWRTDRVPYLREILDAVSDPTVERVVIQAASQVGKSEILLSTIGYFAHQDPSPILFVQATEEATKNFSQERIASMFEASPALRDLVSSALRDPTNKVMLRMFPGGLLACGWAGSAASLAARPIRVLLNDEIDRWPISTGRDGDPHAQAEQRTSNFFNRKIIDVSSPTDEGSAIARLYELTDRRQYQVPCPRCGVFQVLVWAGVIYKNADGKVDLDGIHYRCADCGGRIEEREKPEMLAAGEWVADERAEDEDPPPPGERGYQISALYSPWVRWRELATQWIKANADRDKRGLQEFINLRLGERWEGEGEKITVEALEKNRGAYDAEIPDGVLLLTVGVDVQDNRLEAEVVGWGVDKQSWGIEYQIFPGDTSLAGPWSALDKFIAAVRLRADGRGITVRCTFVDSGGHRTQEVYRFAYERAARNVFASKGSSLSGQPIAGKPSQANQLRINLIPIGTDTAKEAIMSRLALPTPGPGYCHFPIGRGYDAEYFKGLTGEKRQRKRIKGRLRLVWVQTHPRNEPLDCRVYATAAMELANPDFAQLAADEEKARAVGVPMIKPQQQRRRVLSRGVG